MQRYMRHIGGGILLLAGIGLFSADAQPVSDPEGLWGEATLYRDEYGVPHVQGRTLRGLAFGFGYAQASDHLESMLMAYRIATGRAAAVGGEAFAAGDAFAVKIANRETARKAFPAVDGETRALCEGFALGINAWIFDHQDEVPSWVEGVQPVDVLAYWHFLMVTSAPFDLPGVYHPAPPLQQANAWALAPENTVDGRTLLVMSPYQYYRAPYQWYEAHLMLGDMNWSGATLIGVPVLMMGHNAHLGWALTPNGADTADMYREDLTGPDRSPKDPTTPDILADMAPILNFMATAKTYHVRSSGGLIERSAPSHVGSRGPLLEGGDGQLYSWRNAAYNQFGGMRQLLRMGQARDLVSFQDALMLHHLPCFQVVYADRAGNLAYLYNARTGHRNAVLADDRQTSIDWTEPQESSLDRLAWGELVRPTALPYVENPAAGFVQACGTPPWLASVDAGLAPADWPAWLVSEDANYRGYRVRQILGSGRYHLDDMAAMLYDTLVPAAVDMVPLILGMAEARPALVRSAHPDLVTGLKLLEGWNLTSDRDNVALVYYSRWWAIMKERYEAEFGGEADLYRGLLANTPDAQVSVLEAAADAARAMRNEFGRLDVVWGEVHRLRRGGREAAMFGAPAGDAIFQTDTALVKRGRRFVESGYGFAMAVAFGETPEALSIVPFGASQDPHSLHYSDQMTLFLERDMKPALFAFDAVARHAEKGFGRHVVLGAPGLDGLCAFRTAAPGPVSVETVTYPPRPYPEGMEPFAPVLRPVFDDNAADVTWELEWTVPESVCAPLNRPQLRFFAYTRDAGWEPVLRQSYSDDTARFSGAGTGVKLLALMGPSRVREEAPEEAPEGATESAEATESAPPEEADMAPAAGQPKSGAFTPPKPAPAEGPALSPVVDGDGTPEATPSEEPVVKTAPPAPRPLFDIEYMEGAGPPAGAPGDGSAVEPEKEEKKGLRGLFDRIRGKD